MSGQHTPGNPPAFPHVAQSKSAGSATVYTHVTEGMTLRDWFAGQAIGWVADNNYPEWQLKAWFGERTGIKRSEIQARAAYDLADAMLAERAKGGAA